MAPNFFTNLEWKVNHGKHRKHGAREVRGTINL
jgi:hypothetical protein